MGVLADEILDRGKGSHTKDKVGYCSCSFGEGSCMDPDGPDCDVA